jgi:hypothetical protein
MSLRRWIAVAGTTALLSSGLIASAPSTTAAVRYDEDNPHTWGSTRAPDQVLRKGCHRYRYHYRVNVPDWAGEVFLINPRGRRIATDVVFVASEPRAGWRRFTTDICRASAPYGRYTIRMKVTWNPDEGDPTPDNIDGFVKNSSFRMTRPPRR